MKVEKSKAVALFVAMGFKTAGKWDAEKLTEKINLIEDAPEKPLEDEALDGLLDEILGAAGDIVVVDDEAEGDEEEEPEADDEDEKPKKGKKDKKAKATKKPVKKNLNRIHAVTDILRKLKKSGATAEDIIKAADDAYVADGGNSNLKEAGYSTHRVIQVMERLGMVSVEDGKVRPVNPV